MSSHDLALLREAIVANYRRVHADLTRVLGSEDLASDALQELYLKLQNDSVVVGPVARPRAYLLKIAINIARDLLRTEARRGTLLRQSALDAVRDEVQDFSRDREAKDDLAALQSAVAAMPQRRRAILSAARIEGLPHDEIATKLGISRSLVQRELRRALADIAIAVKKSG